MTTSSRTGVRVFDSERAQIDRPGTLLEAYDLVPSPKPTLERVIRLAMEGKLSVEKSALVMRVESTQFFREELEEWMATTKWAPSQPATFMASLPTGYITLTPFLREHVSLADGQRVGLYSEGKSYKQASLSDRARGNIRAGGLPSAATHGERHLWIARQSDTEEWLWRVWGLEIKR